MNNGWWPAAGYCNFDSGALIYVGTYGRYWSSTRSGTYYSYCPHFDYDGDVYPSNYNGQSYGFSVRCVQEERCASRGTRDGVTGGDDLGGGSGG